MRHKHDAHAIYPCDQSMVVVVRQDGMPAVFMHPEKGMLPGDAARVLRAIADRMEQEAAA